jgi:hypothetical protein
MYYHEPVYNLNLNKVKKTLWTFLDYQIYRVCELKKKLKRAKALTAVKALFQKIEYKTAFMGLHILDR